MEKTEDKAYYERDCPEGEMDPKTGRVFRVKIFFEEEKCERSGTCEVDCKFNKNKSELEK